MCIASLKANVVSRHLKLLFAVIFVHVKNPLKSSSFWSPSLYRASP